MSGAVNGKPVPGMRCAAGLGIGGRCELLNDRDLQGPDLVAKGDRREEGIGIIEAPRGNLIHHYKVDEND